MSRDRELAEAVIKEETLWSDGSSQDWKKAHEDMRRIAKEILDQPRQPEKGAKDVQGA